MVVPVQSLHELTIRCIYDALPQIIGPSPNLDIYKADYFPANTTRNATDKDMFEVTVVHRSTPPRRNTRLDVKDITTEEYRRMHQKCFSVGGEYSQENVAGLIPYFTNECCELGLRGKPELLRNTLVFSAHCPYDEITPVGRAVPSLQQAIIDVAALWNQLREQAAKNTNPTH